MASDARVITPVDLMAAKKQADRHLSKKDLSLVKTDDKELLRDFIALFIASSRAGLSQEHSLEVAAGVSRNGHEPITIMASSLDDVLTYVSKAPEKIPELIAGVHEYCLDSSTPPESIIIDGRPYFRKKPPEKKFLIGLDNQLHEIEWSVEQLFLYNPLSGNPQREEMYPAVLLYGPPGTGKSSLCRAAINRGGELSKLTGLPFRYEVFTPADHSKWVGEGAKAIRRKFGKVSSYDGVGLFVIDDIDMVFESRDDSTATHGGLQVTAELMQQLSGVVNDFNGNTLVIGTTNRSEKIDGALSRRFSSEIEVPGYSSIDDYKAYFSFRAPWMSSDEVDKNSAYGLREGLQPAALDNLCRKLGRERLGRPSLDLILGQDCDEYNCST